MRHIKNVCAGPTERQWQEMADLEQRLFFAHRAENRLDAFRADARQRGQHLLYIEHPLTAQSLGYCLYGLGGISAQIVKLAVHPQWHRRGFGRALLRTAVNNIKGDRRVQSIQLHVEMTREEALLLYKSEGFLVDAPVEAYYGYNLPCASARCCLAACASIGLLRYC
jgi:ribosomal protein S18 acetylase RimI-like enzyme